MNHFYHISVLIFFLSSVVCATSDGPDNFDVRGIASNDALWMHPVPNYQSEKTGKIPYNGTCIQNLGCKNKWCRVKYQGIIGWVNGKFLMEGGNCLQASSRAYNQKNQPEFTQQILKGRVLQIQKFGSDLTVKFLPPSLQSFDGDMVFHFATNADDDNETLSYKLINGKIIYYGNDGSKYRMTLLSITNGMWTVLEEEDVDGDGNRFAFSKAVKNVYKVQGNTNALASSRSCNNEEYEKLYMQIYGRLDTRIASRRDFLEEINKFMYTASLLLIKKHKLDIKMQKIREHQMASVGVAPEVIGLTNALSSIENLDGMEMRDFDGKKLNKLAELKLAYAKAIKTSTLYQKDNYKSEETREKELTKLKDMLAYSGSTEDKNDMKDAEIKKLKGEYNYYKKLLDTPSIWCMRDKGSTQKKPLFYPKTFIIERLYQKYKTELDNSNKSYNPQELSRRAKELETISQKLKQSFNNDYLYKLRTKPYSVKDLF